VLLLSMLLAFYDLRLIQKSWKKISGGEFEYNILLPETKVQKLQAQELVVVLLDFLLMIGVAIILGFTMKDVRHSYSTMLVVYASIPYFAAG
jgi:hypothetical protein